MKKIKCSGGEVVLVDDDDYPLLKRHKWSFTKYAHARLNTTEGKHRNIYMHQMILGCHRHVDHKDGNTKNYQKDNLRHSTRQQNGWNRKKQKDSARRKCTSKYKGVSRVVGRNGNVYWNVQIKTTKKGVKPAKYVRKNRFKTEEGAALWYDEQIVKLRGKWASTNILKNMNNQLSCIGT